MKPLIAIPIVMLLGASDAHGQQDRWFGRDKALHFGLGAAIAAGGYALGALVFDGRDRRLMIGFSLCTGAGAGKEIRDRRSGGDPSWRDFAWTTGGAAVGAGAAWLVDRARQRSDPPR